MNLNFFTAEYPFRGSESYIENEIPILGDNFSKIKIFPHFFEKENHRDIPKNAEICQLNESFNGEELSILYWLLIIKFFIIELFYARNKVYYLKNFGKWLSLLKIAAKKAVYIKNNNLLLNDAVCYSFWMNDWALVLVFLKEKKIIKDFVFRCGGFDIWDERYEGNYLPFRGLVYKYTTKVFPNTLLGEEYIKERTSFPKKIAHKYFGTKDFGIGRFNDEDPFTIVSISNVIPLKRVELIIEILKHVKIPYRWIHFGDGPEMDNVKLKAKKYLNANQYSFAGRLPNFSDVLKCYSEYTVNLFISTSSTEGLPVTIQESISFGVPIIATNVGGVSEIVNETTGYLIDKNFDPKEVAKLIEEFSVSEFNSLKKRERIRTFWKQNFEATEVYSRFCVTLKR